MLTTRRDVRRTLLTLAATASLLAVGAAPAHARTCTTEVGIGSTEITSLTTPCPGPQDQTVRAPAVWVTTDFGPGFANPYWSFAKVEKGSRLFFVNGWDGEANRYHGPGFDSGVVPSEGFAEVLGVSSLSVGEYPVYDINDKYVGELYIEPGTVCVECVTSDS